MLRYFPRASLCVMRHGVLCVCVCVARAGLLSFGSHRRAGSRRSIREKALWKRVKRMQSKIPRFRAVECCCKPPATEVQPKAPGVVEFAAAHQTAVIAATVATAAAAAAAAAAARGCPACIVVTFGVAAPSIVA